MIIKKENLKKKFNFKDLVAQVLVTFDNRLDIKLSRRVKGESAVVASRLRQSGSVEKRAPLLRTTRLL